MGRSREFGIVVGALVGLAALAPAAPAAELTGPERIRPGSVVRFHASGFPPGAELGVHIKAYSPNCELGRCGYGPRKMFRTDAAGMATVQFTFPITYGEVAGEALIKRRWRKGDTAEIQAYAFIGEVDVIDASAFAKIIRPRRGCNKPRRRTKSRRACFRFSSSSAGVHHQCKLTGRNVPRRLKSWRRCSSPRRYRGLKPGRKVFRVRAVSGGRRGKPDRYVWTVLP